MFFGVGALRLSHGTFGFQKTVFRCFYDQPEFLFFNEKYDLFFNIFNFDYYKTTLIFIKYKKIIYSLILIY